MTAAERLLSKALVGSGLDSRQWSGIQAGLRDRAFFMAKVEEQRILHAARRGVADILESGKSASEVRRDLREVLKRLHYDPGEKRGTVQDLTTRRRLDVMIETNVGQARGWAQHMRATTEGALAAFPAYELVRVKQRRAPRDWRVRWRAAGGRLYAEGRMIALKTDPVWAAISRFGNPFPPFDYNSGMGLDDVGRRECVRLGVIDADTPPQKPPEVHFNGSLHAEVQFKNDEEWQRWKESFGDQVQKVGDKVMWRDDVFKENFDKGGEFTIRLGTPTKALIGKLPQGVAASDIEGNPLTIKEQWLDRKRRDGVSDHRVHFAPMPDHPENIPLEERDVAMLPSMWRNPDRVFESSGHLVLEVDALDGSIFRAFVKYGRGNTLRSFYRTTETWDAYLRGLKKKRTAPSIATLIPTARRGDDPRGGTERLT